MEQSAGFWVRLFANLIDSAILGSFFAVITFVFYGEIFAEQLNVTDFLGIIYGILVPVLWRGYVIGKRLMKIRIVKVSGENVTIVTMLLRVVVSGLIYGLTLGIAMIISALMVGIREDKRAIHDLIAGTYVKHENSHTEFS